MFDWLYPYYVGVKLWLALRVYRYRNGNAPLPKFERGVSQ